MPNLGSNPSDRRGPSLKRTQIIPAINDLTAADKAWLCMQMALTIVRGHEKTPTRDDTIADNEPRNFIVDALESASRGRTRVCADLVQVEDGMIVTYPMAGIGFPAEARTILDAMKRVQVEWMGQVGGMRGRRGRSAGDIESAFKCWMAAMAVLCPEAHELLEEDYRTGEAKAETPHTAGPFGDGAFDTGLSVIPSVQS